MYNIWRCILDYLNKIWNFFTSVKLSVILLASLGTTSIIGTLIPQNESPGRYLEAFGDFYYRLFLVFDFFDMYRSWWFQLLILLLTLNIIICSVDRLSSIWKIVFVKIPPFRVSSFRNRNDKKEFTDNRSTEQLEKIFNPIVTRGFGYSRVEKTKDGFTIFAEKWRWTRLGVYIVHLSIIFLLVGALIGSFFGFEGYVNIPEGETIDSIRIRNSNQMKKLDFVLRCDDFNVTYYESGSPKEYKSSLTVLESGSPVLQKDIIVNDPLRYKGVNFFQSSYGKLPPDNFTLLCTSKTSGKAYNIDLKMGVTFDLPEEMGKLLIDDYSNSFNFRGRSIGEVLIGVLLPKDQKPVDIAIPLRFPSFDEMRKGQQIFSVAKYNENYYTGLQVTKDPGVWVVYSGFIFMILGCFITFFMSHQRVCVEVIKDGENNKIMVAGKANKNKLGMQNKIIKLFNKLKETNKQ